MVPHREDDALGGKMLSIRHVAKIFDVPTTLVREWVDSGRLRGWRAPSGQWRVLYSDVQQWLEETTDLADSLSRDRRRRTIVVVGDQSAELESYRELLGQLRGVHIELANGGFSGLIKIAASKPVIVISKLRMAPFDGFQMIRILKEDKEFRDLQVIAFSALSDSEIFSSGGLPKDVIHIREPVDLYELKDCVTRLAGFCVA